MPLAHPTSFFFKCRCLFEAISVRIQMKEIGHMCWTNGVASHKVFRARKSSLYFDLQYFVIIRGLITLVYLSIRHVQTIPGYTRRINCWLFIRGRLCSICPQEGFFFMSCPSKRFLLISFSCSVILKCLEATNLFQHRRVPKDATYTEKTIFPFPFKSNVI